MNRPVTFHTNLYVGSAQYWSCILCIAQNIFIRSNSKALSNTINVINTYLMKTKFHAIGRIY